MTLAGTRTLACRANKLQLSMLRHLDARCDMLESHTCICHYNSGDVEIRQSHGNLPCQDLNPRSPELIAHGSLQCANKTPVVRWTESRHIEIRQRHKDLPHPNPDRADNSRKLHFRKLHFTLQFTPGLASLRCTTTFLRQCDQISRTHTFDSREGGGGGCCTLKTHQVSSRIRPLRGLRGAAREREITYVRESCWQQAQLGLLLLLY